ncbi:MAG TPA: hypothetical protein VH041_15230 [Caldimonas sp.]|nr:hypothetical protein [Caldimonas sp.]
MFSTVLAAFGGCGVPRLVGVRLRDGWTLVRCIEGDADLAPRVAREGAFFAGETLFFAADPDGRLAEALRLAAVPFALPVPCADRPLRAVSALASIALRAGEARSDFA